MKIQLTRGKESIIDDMDSDLAKLNWCAQRNGQKYKGQTENISWYAVRSEPRPGRGIIKLHRIILERVLDRKLNKKECVDHINHDSLDNRRKNLRLSTRTENIRNSRKRSKNTSSSKFKGVAWYKQCNRWIAQICVDCEDIYLGCYVLEEDAAKAYDKAAKDRFGQFCSLNFP